MRIIIRELSITMWLFVLCLSVMAHHVLSQGDEECRDYSLELMYLQDASSSFADDIPILRTKLPEMFHLLEHRFPGSKYGLANFVDIPIPTLGFGPDGTWFDGDWCYFVDRRLLPGPTEDDIDTMLNRLLGGGNDWPENQLGAMHDLALSAEKAGWTTDEFDSQGRRIVRVMVVSTDSLYHKAGDALGSPYFLTPNNGTGEDLCDRQDYPSILQVSEALKSRGIVVIFLTGMTTHQPIDDAYTELLTNLGVSGAVRAIAEDSYDIVESLNSAIDELFDHKCTTTVDIAFVQDTTYSYKNDMPRFYEQLEDVVNEIDAKYFGVRYALTSFADKPFAPFGHLESGDYCFKVHQDLTRDRASIINAGSEITTVSGLDWKESQLDAMMHTLDGMRWRQGRIISGRRLVRLVVLATDSGWHEANDVYDTTGNAYPRFGSGNACEREEYVDREVFYERLRLLDVNPIFVPTSDIAHLYREMAQEIETRFNIISYVVELDNFTSLSDAISHATGEIIARL